MATSDRLPDVSELLSLAQQRYANTVPADTYEPGDLSRMGVEALVQQNLGTSRVLKSSGALRFTGDGVSGHSANLDDIGALSSAWQKAITATGASIESITTARGPVPASVVLRTQLVVTASPLPGSVVLNLAPKELPLKEVEPGNQTVAEGLAERPLADRASERLVEFLSIGQGSGDEAGEQIASQLRQMGPRVGGAVNALARTIQRTKVTLDVSWREPAAKTKRVKVSPSHATYLRHVVEGRGLDAEPVILVGELQTISRLQRWAIETNDDLVQFDASELPAVEFQRWNVGDVIEVSATVALREWGDGRVERRYTATGVRLAPSGHEVLGDETDA